MYTLARPQRGLLDASLSIGTQENAPRDRHGMYRSMQKLDRPFDPLDEDISNTLTPPINSLGSPESTHCTTSTPKHFQTFCGLSNDVSMDRLGTTMPQEAEHPLLFDPYNCQHQGLVINMGTHLSHNLGQVQCKAPLYTSSNKSSYTWQANVAGRGYQGL